MGRKVVKEISAILFAIIGVMLISVLVSRSAKTIGLIQALTTFFVKVFGQILAPVSTPAKQ